MIRKVSLKAAGFAVLSAGFALGLFACAKPVNIENFLEGISVKGLTVTIDFDNVKDKAPELDWSDDGGANWTDLAEEVTVNLPHPGSAVIRVKNQDEYDSIAWFCDSDTALTSGEGVGGANDSELTVTAGTAPFDTVKKYHLTIEGKKDETPYSTFVFIEVQ